MTPPPAAAPIVRRALLLAIVVGLVLRGVVLTLPPIVTPDSEGRYEPLARNIARGHGLSADAAPPYRPDAMSQPGYPLFLAAVYRVAGDHRRAVMAAQMVLELVVVVCIWRLAHRLALPPRARALALTLALLCPVLPVIARAIWSEMLATALLTVTCLAWLDAARTARWTAWLWSGAGAGACLLVRADLLPAVGLAAAVALAGAWRRVGARAFAGLAVAVLASSVLLGAWAARNYQQHGRLQPLGGYVAQLDDAYARWLGTWMDDLEHMAPYWWYAGLPGYPTTYPEDKVVDGQERARANAILAGGRPALQRAEASAEFAALTRAARQDRPFRTFVVVPARRLVNLWLNVAAYVPHPTARRLAMTAWAAVLVAALAGMAAGVRRDAEATLLLAAVVAGRSVLPLFIGIACEPRYVVEALPAVFLLAAFTPFTLARRPPPRLAPPA